jgi:hypothetical protein
LKRIAVLVCIVGLAACGGGGTAAGGGGAAATPHDVVSEYLYLSWANNFSAAYDLLHPEVQARTTRAGYISCRALGFWKGATPTITITETTAAVYRRSNGSTTNGFTVGVTTVFGTTPPKSALVWVVDGRIADSGGSHDCETRL